MYHHRLRPPGGNQLASSGRSSLSGGSIQPQIVKPLNALTLTSRGRSTLAAAGWNIQTSAASPMPALGSLAFYANAGADDYATLTSLPATFGTGEFTFEFRCKLDESLPVGAAGGTSTVNWSSADPAKYTSSSWWYPGNFLLDGHNNTDIRLGTFSVQVIGGGRLRWSFGDNTRSLATGGLRAVQPVPASSAPSLLDDKRHHVALVRRWTGTTTAILEMWIDGALIASETTTARQNMQTYWSTWAGYGGGIQNGWVLGAEKFSAGGGTYWDDYKGQLSYLRFYSRAKTPTELANDWAINSSGAETGLVGLFACAQPVANQTFDSLRPAAFITTVARANPIWLSDVPAFSVSLSQSIPTQTFARGVAENRDMAALYSTLFNPAVHEMRRAPDSAALPASVQLLPTGVLAYDGSGTSDVSVSNVRLAIYTKAEADWLARSSPANGVVLSERFDTLQIGPGPGGGRYYNGSYGQRGFRDTTGPRVSGTGSLRLEHRSGENAVNMTGQYSRFVSDGGGLLPQSNAGAEFWVQFRYRIDSNWYNNQPTWAGMAHKVMLLFSDNISCGQIELSLQGWAGWLNSRPLRMYTGCGSPNLFTETTSPNNRSVPAHTTQQRWNLNSGPSWTKEPGFEITRNANDTLTLNPAAFIMLPNIWYTFDVRVRPPSPWGASNCRVEARATEAGQTQRQKFVAWIGPMGDNGVGETNRMNNISLTGYFSDGANNAGTTGPCWYDELIVSTQPIALPAALPVSP